MFMTLATSLVVLFNCYATADILTKLLQQCFLLSLLLLYLGNSQVSVYLTIGPTLVFLWYHYQACETRAQLTNAVAPFEASI